MPSPLHRRLAGLWLCLWILAAASSQLIQLHVAIEHGDGGHHEAHSVAAPLDHHRAGAHHSDHEHDLSITVDDEARIGSRLHPLASPLVVAVLPIEWQHGTLSSSELSVPDPRPRGTPPGLRNPHILRI